MSATQGAYTTAQLLLDITQGARVASSAYPQPARRRCRSRRRRAGRGDRRLARGASAPRRRRAPQLLRPGLLAARSPAAAGYAGIAGADTRRSARRRPRRPRRGRLAGQRADAARRASQRCKPRSQAGRRRPPRRRRRARDLRALSPRRAAGELLIVVQRVPDAPGGELLWSAAAGLPGGGGHELSSQTTNQRGLIAAVDLAPTILAHLDLGRSRPTCAAGRSTPTGRCTRRACAR